MSTIAEKETCDNQCQTAAPERARYLRPAVNIVETPEAWLLEAELPGVNKSGLDINVEGRVLTITGRPGAAPEGKPLLRESAQADFRRSFELDADIDDGRITAKLEQGILTLTLPKAEKAKPRRVEIN